jgi:hypothetical protein
MASSNMSRERAASVRIVPTDYPGFHTAPDYVPRVGEQVQTTEGRAEVVSVLTRLTDGRRLLELRLEEKPKPPFFAASDNVLVRDDEP